MRVQNFCPSTTRRTHITVRTNAEGRTINGPFIGLNHHVIKPEIAARTGCFKLATLRIIGKGIRSPHRTGDRRAYNSYLRVDAFKHTKTLNVTPKRR